MIKYLIIMFITIGVVFSQNQINTIKLTEKEKAWLIANPKITMVVPKNFPRSYLNKNGKLEGMDIDYFNLIEKKLGIKFDKTILAWNDALKLAMNHEVDIIINAGKLKSREPYLDFSKTYFATPQAIVSYNNESEISYLNELCGKKVAVHKGSSKARFLQKNYPCIKLFEVTDKKNILTSIIMNKAYAGFDNFDSLSGNIKRMLVPNLKVIYFKYMPPVGYARVGIRKDKPILTSVIDKAISSISIEEKNKIVSKWLNVKLPPIPKKIDQFKKTKLSLKEKIYLKNKKEIKVCVDPSWMPFEKIENGKHTGLASDYIKIISKSIGIPITLVETKTWAESIRKATNRECDIYSLVSKTPKREKYMDFTIPYLETPIVIATKKYDKFVTNIDTVKNKKLGIVKGYSIIELYKSKYPDINIVEVDSISDGLSKVEKGEIFGYLDNSIVITNQIQKKYVGILQISGKFDTKLKFGIASRNDEKELVTILNKVIDKIDEKTKTRILNDWVSIKNNISDTQQFKLTKEELDYIKNNIITINTTTSWLPFNYKDDKDNIVGVAVDFWKIIAKKYNIKYKIIEADHFSEVLNNIKNKKYDLNFATANTVNSAKFSIFSNTYEKYPISIATNSDELFIKNDTTLNGKTIAVGKNYSAYFIFKEKYPEFKYIFTSNTLEALKLLDDDKVFGVIDIEPSLFFQVAKNNFKNIKIHSNTDLFFNLQIMLKNDNKILQSIINKSIKIIADNEKIAIYKKWMNTRIHSSVDYGLIWQIIGLFSIVLIIILYFLFKQNRLKEEIQSLNKSLEDKVKKEVLKNRQKDQQLLQQSRLAQMGEMIAMIAHQWRQPLAAISSTSNAINLKARLNKLDKETSIKLTSNIIEYSHHLSNTIDDFRNFFKSNKEKNEVCFNEIIKSVLNIVGTTIEDNNIKLIQDLNNNDKFLIYSSELKQVILNLLKNSEDILLEKNISNPYIKISTYKQEDKIILEVSDNGGGIEDDIVDSIFDPYFSTKTQKDGTGLGLYMSKTIIEEHCNGELSVSNSEDGAVFSIKLKMKEIL